VYSGSHRSFAAELLTDTQDKTEIMPLALMAKDSIQDLTSLGSEPAPQSSKESSRTSSPAPPADRGDATKLNVLETSGSIETTGSESGSLRAKEGAELSSGGSETEKPDSANPQQPPMASNTAFHYEGYDDYYYQDDADQYASADYLMTKRNETGSGGLWMCLFPWMQTKPPEALPEQKQQQQQQPRVGEQPVDSSKDEALSETHSNDDDAESQGESTNSNQLGERLSEKERQAVLARLGLAQPEAAVSNATGGDNSSSSHDEQQQALSNGEDSSRGSISNSRKGLLNGIPVFDTSPLEEAKSDEDGPPGIRGILKKRSNSKINESVMKNGVLINPPHRTSIESSATTASSKQLQQQQASRRRRSLFPSYEERSKPKSTNHVTFAPMARVVTVKSKNDMTDEEKADIWWRRSDYEDFRRTGRIITRAMLEGGSEIWLASNDSPAKNSPPDSGDIVSAPGDKWWHKFGHSRRGLEHVVSVEEGRQRQANVKTAIRAVLEEQTRQKMYKRVDPEKLRIVALHHTSWARDLALASGASDADAVESSFAADRRSREFYLLKLARSSPINSVKTGRHVPQFMQSPVSGMHKRQVSSGTTATPLLQQRLDANTAAQIQFRRQKVAPEKKDSSESCEPVHDPASEEKAAKESLKHQAAGFSADGGSADMAAVLSGMGVGLTSSPKKEEALPAMKVAT